MGLRENFTVSEKEFPLLPNVIKQLKRKGQLSRVICLALTEHYQKKDLLRLDIDNIDIEQISDEVVQDMFETTALPSLAESLTKFGYRDNLKMYAFMPNELANHIERQADTIKESMAKRRENIGRIKQYQEDKKLKLGYIQECLLNNQNQTPRERRQARINEAQQELEEQVVPKSS